MSTNQDIRLLVSCEHGGNRVPDAYGWLFEDAGDVLFTHRAYDIGALELARFVASLLQAPLVAHEITRLIIEVNRSLHHPRLFSEFSKKLDKDERQTVIEKFYQPHRDHIERKIGGWIEQGFHVLHLAVHTFTPVYNRRVREADVGLLYDPAYGTEKAFCKKWQKALKAGYPGLRIRRNYPYRGDNDGLTTYLRKKWADREGAYLGIELEVNQRFYQVEQSRERLMLRVLLGDTLGFLIEEMG